MRSFATSIFSGLPMLGALSLAACEPAPAASEPFSDAAVAALGAFDDPEPDTLVKAFEQLEAEITDEVDPAASDFTKRALSPHGLTDDDVAGVDHPDRDPALTLPVALVGSSTHTLTDHDAIVAVVDQVGIEPYSQSYARTFLEGEDCYPADCEFVRTSNAVTKKNPAMTVSFTLMKDWRTLSLTDGRAARASRGWMEAGATSDEDADRIEQSFAIELWIDQEDGTTLRLLVLWAETTFAEPQDEALVAWTTELGMNELFRSHDAWIEGNR